MTAADTDSGSLISERVAGGILPKVLTAFDMVAIFVAIVLFITNAAVVQSAGPSARSPRSTAGRSSGRARRSSG